MGGQPPAQPGQCFQIMPHVEHALHATVTAHLAAADETGIRHLVGGVVRRWETGGHQRLAGGGQVVRAQARGQRQWIMALPLAVADRQAGGLHLELAAGAQRHRLEAIQFGVQVGGGVFLPVHQGPPCPADAEFLHRHFFAGVTQPVGVVQAHGGDHRHVRVDQIDRVQAAAQPHFQNRQVGAAVAEQPQRRQGGEFEIGQRGVAAGGVHLLEGGAQGVVVHRAVGQRDAFVEALQMGGGIDAHAAAGGGRQGAGERHHRALAVGAGDGDHRHRQAGRAERLGHPAHPLQAQLDLTGVEFFNARQPGVQADAHSSAGSASGAPVRLARMRCRVSRMC